MRCLFATYLSPHQTNVSDLKFVWRNVLFGHDAGVFILQECAIMFVSSDNSKDAAEKLTICDL